MLDNLPPIIIHAVYTLTKYVEGQCDDIVCVCHFTKNFEHGYQRAIHSLKLQVYLCWCVNSETVDVDEIRDMSVT